MAVPTLKCAQEGMAQVSERGENLSGGTLPAAKPSVEPQEEMAAGMGEGTMATCLDGVPRI